MDRGTWRAIVHGVTRVRHDLVTKPSPPPPYPYQEYCLCACLLSRCSCSQLCNTMDYSPAGFQYSSQEYWGGLLFPLPGDLLDAGIKLVSMSPALAGGFFTTSGTWEAHQEHCHIMKMNELLLHATTCASPENYTEWKKQSQKVTYSVLLFIECFQNDKFLEMRDEWVARVGDGRRSEVVSMIIKRQHKGSWLCEQLYVLTVIMNVQTYTCDKIW